MHSKHYQLGNSGSQNSSIQEVDSLLSVSQSKVARLYSSSGSVLSWSLKWKAKNRSKVKSKKVSLLKKYPWATFEYNLNGIWMKTLEIPAQTGLLGIFIFTSHESWVLVTCWVGKQSWHQFEISFLFRPGYCFFLKQASQPAVSFPIAEFKQWCKCNVIPQLANWWW